MRWEHDHAVGHSGRAAGGTALLGAEQGPPQQKQTWWLPSWRWPRVRPDTVAGLWAIPKGVAILAPHASPFSGLARHSPQLAPTLHVPCLPQVPSAWARLASIPLFIGKRPTSTCSSDPRPQVQPGAKPTAGDPEILLQG